MKPLRIAILAVLWAALSFPAYAQVLCMDRTAVVAHLDRKYDEVPVAIGLANNGSVVEVLASDKTWTIIVTTPNGTACMIAAGENWETVVKVKGRGA